VIRLVRILCSVVLLILLGTGAIQASWLESGLYERNDGGYFTLVDESGKVLTYTARILDVGDSYISADNIRYEVIEVDGDLIKMERKEEITLPDITDIKTATPPSIWQRLFGAATSKQNSEDQDWKVIGIYHTHNDESYVPTSGTESETPGGDIMEVGKALASALEKLGYTVVWSDNSHLPHDGEAYVRSRRTALELIKHKPATLIDVHRDATPPEVYETEIDGKPSTKVRIVVGRQNENREMTLEYAKRIKAVADSKYPGIIEGIFDARGNYNQDLGPRMILLEFGAHTNPLELAEQAAQFFAEIIPAAAGLSSQDASQREARQTNPIAGSSIFWILAIVGIVIVGYLLINKQGLQTIGSFFRREFGGDEGDDSDE